MIHLTVDGVGGESVFLTDYLLGVYPNAKSHTLHNAEFRADIYLNGTPITDDVFVADGDEIDLNLYFFHLGTSPILDILYEDEHFIAVEKMPGVLSFDEYKTGDINVYDMTLEYMLQKGEYSVDSMTIPYLCYALPEFSGGILFIAKHEEAYRYMTTALTQRKVHRVFEAVVAGHPKADVDEIYHYMDNMGRIFPLPREGAFPIVTRYQSVSKLNKHTIVEIRPITYRRFQEYAHMAYIGYPVLGDTIYGKKRANKISRLDYEAIWLKELYFSVGDGDPFAYLNHVHLAMDDIRHSNIIFKKG